MLFVLAEESERRWRRQQTEAAAKQKRIQQELAAAHELQRVEKERMMREHGRELSRNWAQHHLLLYHTAPTVTTTANHRVLVGIILICILSLLQKKCVMPCIH
jgi:hypothetical protein